MSIRRGLCVALCGGVFAFALGPAAAPAATLPVGCSGTDGNEAALVGAIDLANSTADADTVQLGQGCTYSLTAVNNNWYGPNALPAITTDVTIDGRGSTIARGTSTTDFRFFFVAADPADPDTLDYVVPAGTAAGGGRLTLRDLTLLDGRVEGGSSDGGGGGAGMGGAIFSQGEVVIERSTLHRNSAKGGSALDGSAGLGGGGIGTDSIAATPGTDAGGGFGAPPSGGFGGGSGGGGGDDHGGGGAGFRTGQNGNPGTNTEPGTGGGPATGLGGRGGGSETDLGGLGGDGSGGGGSGNAANLSGGPGGAFGAGGVGGNNDSDGSSAGGGGGVGGGGGQGGDIEAVDGGGGGGFGGGGGTAPGPVNGGLGNLGFGGDGGFGGGGASGGGGGGAGGFGGGTASTTLGGGGAGMGGAIFNMQGELTIRNSTLTDNAALGGDDHPSLADDGQGMGGAVFNLNGVFTAIGSTFAANLVTHDGAEIYNLVYDSVTTRQAQTTLRNTILSDGTPVDLATDKPINTVADVNRGSAVADVAAFDLVRTMAARNGGTITGTPLTAAAMLGPLASNGGPTQTMAPAEGSPVIDAGSAFGLATDQRGLPRPSDFNSLANAGDGADIGAVELQAPAPPGGGDGGGGAGGGGGGASVPLAFGADTLVALSLAQKRIRPKGPVAVAVSNANGFAVGGEVFGKSRKAKAGRADRSAKPVKLKPKAFEVEAGAKETVKLKLPRKLRRPLRRKGKLKLRMTAEISDPAGNVRDVRKTLKPKLKKKRKR